MFAVSQPVAIRPSREAENRSIPNLLLPHCGEAQEMGQTLSAPLARRHGRERPLIQEHTGSVVIGKDTPQNLNRIHLLQDRRSMLVPNTRVSATDSSTPHDGSLAMKSRLDRITLMVAQVMALGIAGCGGSDPEPAAAQGTSSAPAPAPVP